MAKGWLDNYNDSTTSAPEGFVGEGIFNGPKFDNPAWGGQFQNGGTKKPITTREDFDPSVLSNIPGLTSLASGNQPGYNREEQYGPLGDLYRYYGGQPLEHDVLVESQNKPSTSKDKNAKYISLNHDREFVNEVLDNYERVSSGKLDKGIESKLNDNSWSVSGYSSAGKDAHKTKKQGSEHHSNAIGRYTLGKGKDKKGEYISYYDKFDQGTGDSLNPGEALGLTKPFEIYDRIYLKDVNRKYQMGGNLPGAVGNMYARTGSPSKGPRRNQTDVTDASAQGGTRLNPHSYDEPDYSLRLNPFLSKDPEYNMFIGGVSPSYSNRDFSIGAHVVGVGNEDFRQLPADYGIRGSYNPSENLSVNANLSKNNVGAGMTYRFENGGEIAQNGQEMQYYQQGLDWKPKSISQNGNYVTGDNVTYGTPEYREAYNRGEVITDEGVRSPIQLDEVVIKGKKKDKNWLEQYASKIAEENRDAGLLGAIIGTPISAITSLPQLMGMKALTGEMQRPSEGLDIKNPYGAMAVDAITDPTNLIGAGLLTKENALAKLGNLKIPKFKSEINWSKWNKEIPENPQLMKEYNIIEQSTKKAGSWMKNPDGSAFQGTPEQFVQQNSENFKNAFPDGVNRVYRGVGYNNNNPDFSKGYVGGDRSIFTANKDLAISYVPGLKKDQILTPFSDSNAYGVFDLGFPKGDQINYNAMNSDWTNVDLATWSNKANLEKNLAIQKKYLDTYKNSGREPSVVNNLENHISKLQKQIDDFDKLPSNKEEFNNMKNLLGDEPSTDDIAAYLPKTNLNNITLRNVYDGGFGDVTIVNNRPGNYLKSMVGNNGMFDMTNPNIYKAVVPGAIGLGALQQQKDGGVIKDDRGQWDHPGEITEIGSNEITMEGVPYDVLGVSDTGDTKLMKPGKNYKFKGKKVTEYPMAKNGLRQEQKGLQNLDQLTNFTNYNKPQPGGWLNKYKS